MARFGFISYINSPTRVWDDGESCIDRIFVKKTNKYNIDKAIILESAIIDHYPVFMNINMSCINESVKQNHNKPTFYHFFNPNIFKLLIKQHNWKDIYHFKANNNKIELYITKIKYSIQQSTSKITVKRKVL